jgi:CHAT domain-containing protein
VRSGQVLPFFEACTASAGRKAATAAHRLTRFAILLVIAFHAHQSALAQPPRERAIIKRVYFDAFRPLYQGKYNLASRGFKQASSRAIRTGNMRYIDSICYYTMEGEVFYRRGDLVQALGYFKSALRIYIQNSGWMLHMKFPNTIPPVASVPRLPAWAITKRKIHLGRWPDTFNIMRGGPRLVQNQGKAAIGKSQQLQALHADELVRCIALAIRRYAELLGPLAKQDPLTQEVLETLVQRQGQPNHWSEIWLDLPLGVAYAAAGKKEMAIATLQRSMLAGGAMDHSLTGTAMLALGRLHLNAGEYEQAVNWFNEAALSAFFYDRFEVVDEAFQLLCLAHIASGHGGIPPTLAAATAWANRKNFEEMYASLLLRTAEGYAVAGKVKQAASTLGQVHRAIGRSDMAKGRIGAEAHYVASVISYMQGNAKSAHQSLQAAIDFERIGSVRLFHIKLVDAAYVEGSIRERGAMKLYQQVLEDPSAIVWRHQPLEAFSQLLVPQPVALNHWFEAALKREQPLAALSIVDRIKRVRFFSNLPLGGRLLNLRWIMQGHPASLSREALLQRQEFTAQFPQFAVLDQQAKKIRGQLKKEPLLPNDPQLASEQAKRLHELAKNSQFQENELMKMAVRREPVAMVFPPLRDAKNVQKTLAAGEAILVFHVTPKAHHVFLVTRERHRHWKIASPKKVKKYLTALLRSMGHHDQNRELDLEQLADSSWQVAAQQLAVEITAEGKIDLGRNIKELVIVPDHFYWYVPFEALWVGDDRERTLLAKTRVRYAPTFGLTKADARGRPQSGDYAIVVGSLYPREDETLGQTAFKQIQAVVPRGHAIEDSLQVPSHILAVMLDGLVVLDDLTSSGQDPLSLAPFRVDEGLPGSSIRQWLSLPWGSPDVIVLPGFHTPAENSLKKISTLNRAGDELFLTSMGLLAAGSRTIVLSRWRTGGQTSTDLIREFIQELPNTTAQDSWQRAVQIAQETTIDPAVEPRVKESKEGTEITARHPFFWSGYIVIDPGLKAQEKQPESPDLEFPKK